MNKQSLDGGRYGVRSSHFVCNWFNFIIDNEK
jgi:hypothetical protein